MLKLKKVIRENINNLDPKTKELIVFADHATTNKYNVVRPRLWWTILLSSYSLLMTILLLVMLIGPFIIGRQENILDIWFIFPLLGLFVVIIDIISYNRIKNQYNAMKFYNQYYLYLHPDCIIERSKDTITILPKESLIYAYEEYSYYNFHIAYKGEGLSTMRYQLINNHGIHYSYKDTTGLPSPMRKNIMNLYKLQMPRELDMIDKDEYNPA